MGLRMPSPVRHPKTGIYLLRTRVPADIRERAARRFVTLPVNGAPRRVRAGESVKVSLGTRDPAEAKRRYREADAALQAFFTALREGPAPMTAKQRLALAGEIRATWVAAFDDEPGPAALWDRALAANALAQVGKRSPLSIPTEAERIAALEARYGGIVDVWLSKRALDVEPDERVKLLKETAAALADAVRVNRQKASGDYSDSGDTNRYPTFSAASVNQQPVAGLSFTDIIDAEVEKRAKGRDAVPLPPATVTKFKRHTAEFAAFAKIVNADETTADSAHAWADEMLSKGTQAGGLSNKTIGDKLSSLRTVISWGKLQHREAFFPGTHPVAGIRGPKARRPVQGSRTYTLAEACTILAASREQAGPTRRWLPWLCAYSGARVEEIAGLTKDDFFQVQSLWFMHIRATARRIKGESSERRVPLHPAIVDEGFVTFLQRQRDGVRLFSTSPSSHMSRWVRGTLKITRPVPPNHGWRHLFEDLCTNAGMTDDARKYLTGRNTGTSRDRYGRSDAALPGLAREMAKVERILED